MATFEELYTIRLDRELNSNDSNALYTSTRRQAAINEAAEEFADLTECLIRQSSITVSCNTARYSIMSTSVLPYAADFVRLASQGVEYQVLSSGSTRTWVTSISGDEFPRRDLDWMNRYDAGWRQSTTPTVPSAYYMESDGVHVYLGLNRPPLVGSSQHAKLIVPYVARPKAMTSSGDTPFTVETINDPVEPVSILRYDLTVYHKALPHYAASVLLPLIGDLDGAQRQFALFMGYVSRFLQAARPKGGTHITTARSYFADARRNRGRDNYYSPTVPPSQWK